jgi:2-dehydro-3-deoxygalactonokinase
VAALIAIDWGTTSARASLIDRAGRTIETRSAPLGIQQVQDGRFAESLATLLGDWRALELPRIACGMIGSRQGWVEAPYVPCPVSADSLASALVHTPARELAIVPGAIARDEHGIPDVMRGEETQLAGAVDDGESVLAVLPGTHSKWTHVERGRLVGFETHMTGELYAVLLKHSILGRLAAPAEPQRAREAAAAFAHGAARGFASGGLGHLIFGARTLALTGELASSEVAEWLSGLLIGREIRGARTWAQRRGLDASHVRVIGADALVSRYIEAFRLADVVAEPGHADAAVRGLLRIARRAGLIG